MNDMNKLFNQLLEDCKKDKKKLQALKTMVVKTGQFELAAAIRDIEKTNFPELPEEKEAKEIQTCLGMADLQCTPQQAYIIHETMKEYIAKKGAFSIREASTIKANAQKIFGE